MDEDYGIERPLFFALYKAILGEAFDLARFDTDMLYASEVFERALDSGNAELRNLAAHQQAYRQSDVEVITLKAPERMDRTWLMPTLKIDVVSETAPAAAPSAAPAPAEGGTERRSGMARFTPPEIVVLATLQRLYRKEFGRAMNVEQFVTNDPYGRDVLREALASTNFELVRAAKTFLDDEGRFRRHRRNVDDATFEAQRR